MAPIRVLVVDDHAIVRDGIRALLTLADDMAVVERRAEDARRSRSPGRCRRT